MKNKCIKLLLVEDDHNDAQLINNILQPIKRHCYELKHIDTLEKIRHPVFGEQYDVILLDVSLPPESDPLDAIRVISSTYPTTPIIALDNKFDEKLARKTAKLGVQDYLYKQDLNSLIFERVIGYAIERNKFIEEIKLSKEREVHLLNAAGEGIIGIDLEGKCTFINPAALKMLGYKNEKKLLNKPLHPAIHHTKFDGCHLPDNECQILKALKEARRIHVQDDTFWRSDNSSFSVDYRSMPLEVNGAIYGAVITFSDITERKSMLNDLMNAQQYLEERIQDRTKHLSEVNSQLKQEIQGRANAQQARRKANELNNALIETIGALVIVLDNEGHIVLFNKTCEKTTGYSFREIAGKYIWDILILPEEIEGVRKVFKDLCQSNFPNTHKNHWLTKSGAKRYISWSNTSLADENGNIDYIIGTGLDITDQHITEQKLLKSEHSYRILANNIPAAVYRSTPYGQRCKSSFFNNMIYKMTGYTLEELGKNNLSCYSFVHENDRNRVFKEINQAIENRETFEISYKAKHKNGEIRHFIDRGRPIYSENGLPLHIDGTIIDATETINTNKALKESENKFRGLTEKSLVGVYLIQGGNFLYVNPYFSQIFGYSNDELINTKAIWLINKPERSALISNIKEEINDKNSFHTTFQCTTKSNKIVDIETYGSSTTYNGKPAIIGSLLDITKRKIIEQALQEQMIRYEQILQTSMDGFLLINSQGKIQDANPAYCEMLGYSIIEMHDLNIMDIEVDLDPESFGDRMKMFSEKYLTSYETQNRCKNGNIIDVEVSLSFISTEKDNSAAIFTRDITQRKQQEINERQSLIELAHASRLSTMGEMATEFAHELNQPLSAISTYSSVANTLITAKNHNDEDLLEALKGIYTQANRAGEIIHSLRDFIGKSESSVSLTDINELIRLVTRLVKSEISMNKIKLNLELRDDLENIVTEKILIEQVLLNLTRNAIEAMTEVPDNDRSLTIKSFLNKDQMIEVNVIDNGPGLPYSDPEQVFDAFYSTKHNGMGMGLSICKSIIESHEGRLWVERNTPHGAKFNFSLPTVIEE